MTRTLGILQARMGSTRLPGKVLARIVDRPMLALQIERLRRCRTLDDLVVATTANVQDDAIAALCGSLGIAVVRGSVDDVLDRFRETVTRHPCDTVVRLTGDCPLIDWKIVDLVVDTLRASGADYASNTIEPSWPDGLDVEAMRCDALTTAWASAALPSEREHVTPFIRNNPARFKLVSVVAETDLSAMRWTVDDERDFELVSRIYERLYAVKPDFLTDDILALLKADPGLSALNQGTPRNEGYARSLIRDAAVVASKD